MDTITPKTNDEGQTAVLRSGDWLALRLRSAIADKEWAIACANMETAKGGWTCNWHEAMGAAQREIDAIEVDMGEARNLRIALQDIASATSPSQLFADADKQALKFIQQLATAALSGANAEVRHGEDNSQHSK
jgi:hypothetical protein